MGLNYCGFCGFALELVDGTDPNEIDERNPEWSERYKCVQGHVGTYTYNNQTGEETYAGACENREKAIA